MVQPSAATATPVPDYQEFLAAFQAGSLNHLFAGDFDEGMNAAIECCDRHAQSGRVALYQPYL